MTSPAIVWFRQDLRLGDNPALDAAVQTGRPILCLYVLDDETPGPWRMGGASRWWLHHSLEALDHALSRLGARLILRKGRAADAVSGLAQSCGAGAVFWNRCYEPFAIRRDSALKQQLEDNGCQAKSFNGSLLFEPWEVQTKAGEPFKVFTPFWRACLQRGLSRAPLPAPKALAPYDGQVHSDELTAWSLKPSRPNWARGFEPEWSPGEAGALNALSTFLEDRIGAYADARNMLSVNGTSRLSPHLHFGEISPLQIWAAASHIPSANKFLSEIGWREFSHSLLYLFPTLPEANWRASFDSFPWRDDQIAFRAWTRGRTGYPVVDAAMRELWTTGYMHNRARMIAASFLIKHLMIDWRRGEAWFWDTLLDANLANNAASWQWVAGSGADAAPYFRIFNPVTQGEKFDPDGAYVRRWAPELAQLPNKFIHRPWEASPEVLAAAGVRLGETYPAPIVDHAFARSRALDAFKTLSSNS